jgi:integrase
MAVRKIARSWQFDFKISGHTRQRKAGFRTQAEALEAERQRRSDLISGRKRILFVDAYQMYLSGTTLKPLSRDHWKRCWVNIEPVLGHLYIEEVDTPAMDALKATLPSHLAPSSINHRLALVSAILHFLWKRRLIGSVPYIPRESVPQTESGWYTAEERDRFFDAMFELRPRWFAFYYLSMRLGLRLGEEYSVSKSRIRDAPVRLIIDRAVQRGNKERPAQLGTRKNNKTLTLALTPDLVDAIRWHINQGYSGEEFLFSPSGQFPKYLTSHRRPLLAVQRALGLRELSHSRIGRHSVASQAATGGHSMKAIQAQLGHQSVQSTDHYAHLGDGAQLRLVQDLEPASPPHVNLRSTGTDDEET